MDWTQELHPFGDMGNTFFGFAQAQPADAVMPEDDLEAPYSYTVIPAKAGIQ